jgi:aryl-alcohol dehydrogenase-like predicted oxidoreductase
VTNTRTDSVRRDLAGARVALGTMYFGTTVPEERARRLLDRYVERGGRLIDTANCYAFWTEEGTGEESERVIGRWLADRGARDDVLLATKVGSRPEPPGASWPEHAEGLAAGTVAEQFARSSERLGTDWIDLYFAHIEDPVTELAETLKAFDTLVRAGSVGVLGASNTTAAGLAAAREVSDKHGWAAYEVVQQRHTYLPTVPGSDTGAQRLLEPGLAQYAATHSLLVQGYSPLLGGSYTRPDRPLPLEYQSEANTRRLELLRTTSATLGLTAAQLVLAWMSSGDRPVVPVLGVSTISQLDEAFDALAFDLSEAVRGELDKARDGAATDGRM